MQTFDAELREAERGGAYVEVPQRVVEALGGSGRIPVRATFDGVAYQGSIVSMGVGGAKVLGVRKAIRQQLGVRPGGHLTVTVEVDTAARTVAVPADLAAALSAAGLQDEFSAASFSHRRECVTWIEEAKRAPTREKRVAETVARLGRPAGGP